MAELIFNCWSYFEYVFSVNLPSVNEFSQMFSKLDNDLGSVASHFTFDNFTESRTTQQSIESIQMEESHDQMVFQI